jgi:tetratricopeptide (TPR) repeat protein
MRFLCAVSISLCLRACVCESVFSTQRNSSPQRPRLVEVHWPDLSQLEPEVRTQIKSQQDTLIATINDASSSQNKLGLTYGALGELYQAYSLLAPAEECYLNANRLAPKDFRWIYLLAKLEHLQGRANDAIQNYQLAASLQPTFVPAHINLGNLYLELDRLEEARTSFALALQREPNNAAAHYGLGQVALSRRNYAEAVAHLESALALVPEANRIHYPLALAYRGLGNTERAKAHLAQQGTVGVRVVDPLLDRLTELVQSTRVHMVRGKLALEAKRYDEAAAEFRKAIESEPENVSAYINLGGVLLQLGDTEHAAQQFETALQLDSHNLNAHFNLSVLLAKDNQHKQAIEHLNAVLSINAKDLDARLFLARELAKVDRTDEATVEFSRVVEADPNREAAVIERAQLLQSKGEFKVALEGLEKAHALYPQKVNTRTLLTYTLAASPQTDLRDGTRALKLAQELYSTRASLQNGQLVVLAFAEVGRCDEAAAWQRKLITEASNEGNAELVAKLKGDLVRYDNVKTCRP